MRIYLTAHYEHLRAPSGAVCIDTGLPAPGARPGKVEWSLDPKALPTYVTWYGPQTEPSEAARLSKMLFAAREEIAMWADVVEARSDQDATHTRAVLAEIDAYRAERGWSPHGFGGEAQS
jgi:hypothetical protein